MAAKRSRQPVVHSSSRLPKDGTPSAIRLLDAKGILYQSQKKQRSSKDKLLRSSGVNSSPSLKSDVFHFPFVFSRSESMPNQNSVTSPFVKSKPSPKIPRVQECAGCDVGHQNRRETRGDEDIMYVQHDPSLPER